MYDVYILNKGGPNHVTQLFAKTFVSKKKTF